MVYTASTQDFVEYVKQVRSAIRKASRLDISADIVVLDSMDDLRKAWELRRMSPSVAADWILRRV